MFGEVQRLTTCSVCIISIVRLFYVNKVASVDPACKSDGHFPFPLSILTFSKGMMWKVGSYLSSKPASEYSRLVFRFVGQFTTSLDTEERRSIKVGPHLEIEQVTATVSEWEGAARNGIREERLFIVMTRWSFTQDQRDS